MRTMTPEEFLAYCGHASRKDRGSFRRKHTAKLYRYYATAHMATTRAELCQLSSMASPNYSAAVVCAARDLDAGREQIIVPEFQEERG